MFISPFAIVDILRGVDRSKNARLPRSITKDLHDKLTVIAKGEFSIVKSYCNEDDEPEPGEFAVKLRFKKDLAMFRMGMPENLKWNFDREEKISDELRGHPNIVYFCRSYHEQAIHFQVFEKMVGEELFKSVIGQYDRSHCEMHVTWYMRDIFNALRYCHDKKIIHKNVIPPNLFLARTYRGESVKLLGFSSAVEAKHGDGCYGSVGTVGYRAPETTFVDGYHCGVDVFASGCIMYNLLTGSHPHYFATGKNPSFVSEGWRVLSAQAKDLVIKLLTYDDRDRITAAQALDHDFFFDGSRVGIKVPLTIAVHGLAEFTRQKMWETVTLDNNSLSVS